MTNDYTQKLIKDDLYNKSSLSEVSEVTEYQINIGFIKPDQNDYIDDILRIVKKHGADYNNEDSNNTIYNINIFTHDEDIRDVIAKDLEKYQGEFYMDFDSITY